MRAECLHCWSWCETWEDRVGFKLVRLDTWTAWKSTSRRACFLWTPRKASFWVGQDLDTRSWQRRGPWGHPCLAPRALSGLNRGSSWRNEWDQWWSLGGRSRGRARRCCYSNCCRFLNIKAGIPLPSKEKGREDKGSALFPKNEFHLTAWISISRACWSLQVWKWCWKRQL